jgi:hypothetical protein
MPVRTPAPARIDPPRQPADDPGASDVPFRARKPAPAAPKPTSAPAPAAPRQTARPRKPAAPEPRIFVAPRAPDDPGPEPADGDDLAPYSTSGAKA